MTINNPTNPLAERLREARGSMLNKDLAQAAGWVPSKVSKIEGGRQLPTEEDLKTWARVTGSSALSQWTAMLEQVKADQHRSADAIRAGQAALQREYNEVLASCHDFRWYEKHYAPRFLQTPAYTEALLYQFHQIHQPGLSLDDPEVREDIAAGVAERQASTRYLYDLDRHFELILDEAVLRTPRFSMDIHLAQLSRFQSVIGLPNVRLGIFPQGRLVTALAPSSFEIVGGMVLLENALGEDVKVTTEDVEFFRGQMDLLWRDAVEDDAAVQLIQRIRQELGQ